MGSGLGWGLERRYRRSSSGGFSPLTDWISERRSPVCSAPHASQPVRRTKVESPTQSTGAVLAGAQHDF